MNMVTHRFHPPAFTFLPLATGVPTLACQVVDVVVQVISIPDDDRIPVAQIIYRKGLVAAVYTVLRQTEPVKTRAYFIL